MGSGALSERKISNEWKPKIRDDIFFNDLFATGNDGYCVVGCKGNDSQLMIKMNKLDAFKELLRQLDGTYTIEELIDKTRQDEKNLVQILQMCYDKGFFEEQEEIERFNEVERLSFGVLRHDFKGFSEKTQNRCDKLVACFRIIFLITLLVSVYAVAKNIDVVSNLTIRTAISISGNGWISVVLGYIVIQGLSLLMGMMHEVAHVVVSLKNGGRPHYIAFVLYMGFMPMAYLKQKNIYALKKKSILEILLAGVIMNLFLFMFFGSLYLWTENNWAKMLAVTNIRLAFINLVPFSLTDGYFIFSILSKRPNLRMNFFRLLAYPSEVRYCDKKVLCCYLLYALTILLCFNSEIIILLNVLTKQFHGIKYLILVPVNIIYIIALHRVNLKKVKNIKRG